MPRYAAVFCWCRRTLPALLCWLALNWATPGSAVVLWSDLGATLAHDNGNGYDILGGALKQDNSSTNTLYFKFHVDPLSDTTLEPYFAAFELYENGEERLAVGNSLKAWAYSAFNAAETGESNEVFGDLDLHSSRPEPSGAGASLHYELPRRGIEITVVFKVQYVAGGNDLVTVWLDPDLGHGATEAGQSTNLMTKFKARATFDSIHLRHGGGGGGWTFSDMVIATSFDDFVTGNGGESGKTDWGLGHDPLPFTFRSWLREQGLPQNSVRALAQTRDGYLWVGSDEGVARFDGVRFVPFGSREGFRGGPVRTLLGDSHGGLWIGSAGGGLTHLEQGQVTTYTIKTGLPADSVTALAEDATGRVWIGTEAGLAIWQNGQVTSPDGADKFKAKTITALFKDRHGAMWVGATGAGIFQSNGKQFTPLPDPSAEGLLQDPHCLLVDQKGRIWIGAGDDFVLCRDGDQWRRYRIPHHLARPYVSALAEEPDGTVWAGSVSEGLFEFKDGRLTPITAGSGLSDNLVESMLVDREGKLWVGTDAGLNRLRPKNLSTVSQGDGLGYGAVQGLAEIAPGVIWAGKPSGGLYRSEGRTFNRLNPAVLPGSEPQVNSLLAARDGSCWVATARGALQFKNPKAVMPVAEPLALAGLNVISLGEDSAGGMWAGTREGQLWRLENGNWQQQSNDWQGHAITAIVQDKTGWMWIGTEGDGLHEFRGNAHNHFTKSSGSLESDLIRALCVDLQGTLWIGTAGGGLSRFVNGRFQTFTTREGLPDNTISQILEDDSGRLWLGSDRGIACVSKFELAELSLRQIRSVYAQVYGRTDGMLSEECTSGFCPAGLKTANGLLCFPTLKGIVISDPHPRVTVEPPPAVLMEEVLLDGETDPALQIPPQANTRSRAISDAPELHIPPGHHRVEFRYTGLNFNAPERVRFRYRLEGLDPDWLDAGDAGERRTASYGYVPPGEYHFSVTACNSDGVWNETGASVGLIVLPHYWQTWWFIGLAAIALLLAVGGGVRFVEKGKIQQHLKQLEQERALQRERARIAQDLHDDLGSSLTRISLLSGLARADRDHPKLVDQHATKLAQSAAQTVRALEEIVWAVRPGSDSLQSLVEYIAHFASEMFEGDVTRCRLDLPHNLPARPLPPEVRHDIFLVVKEALTNALKHAAAKEVRVQVKLFGNMLEILVQDDGRGFDPGISTSETHHNGMGNMRRRAEAIGGTLIVKSAPGQGTTVRLAVKIPGPAIATETKSNGRTST